MHIVCLRGGIEVGYLLCLHAEVMEGAVYEVLNRILQNNSDILIKAFFRSVKVRKQGIHDYEILNRVPQSQNSC